VLEAVAHGLSDIYGRDVPAVGGEDFDDGVGEGIAAERVVVNGGGIVIVDKVAGTVWAVIDAKVFDNVW